MGLRKTNLKDNHMTLSYKKPFQYFINVAMAIRSQPPHGTTNILHILYGTTVADQFLGNCEAEQRLCFRYTDNPSTGDPRVAVS